MSWNSCFEKSNWCRAPQKPKKRYKNFMDYISTITARYNLQKGEYPCGKCYGSGMIIDPTEEYDVIEGYKLARRIKCTACKGSRKTTRKYWASEYKKHLIEYCSALDKYKKDLEIWNFLMEKLTEEETKVLGVQLG